jgi:hypothetical protein
MIIENKIRENPQQKPDSPPPNKPEKIIPQKPNQKKNPLRPQPGLKEPDKKV